MADIAEDPHYAARGAIVEVDGVPMQGLVARLSATPGDDPLARPRARRRRTAWEDAPLPAGGAGGRGSAGAPAREGAAPPPPEPR